VVRGEIRWGHFRRTHSRRWKPPVFYRKNQSLCLLARNAIITNKKSVDVMCRLFKSVSKYSYVSLSQLVHIRNVNCSELLSGYDITRPLLHVAQQNFAPKLPKLPSQTFNCYSLRFTHSEAPIKLNLISQVLEQVHFNSR
jgi:hypothetical protein